MSLPEGDKEATLLLLIDDLRRLYDHLSTNYHDLKNRVLALIAGELAIVTFIFSGKSLELSKFTSAEIIFFSVGIGLMALAFGMLLWIVATADWLIPLDLNESRKLYKRYNSKLDYLEYIKEDYEACTEHCLRKVAIRAKVYNRTLLVLSCAIIILLVIKFTSH
ncbi:MAG TPA: hypothetical protein VJ843_03980 [Candidatus Saccharimonadales bacterium]|nr:hypothetical protein [Candidatus Saccharimonadales bacterium]